MNLLELPALPQNRDVERAVLGALMLSFDIVWEGIDDNLLGDLMYDTGHRAIYEAILRLHSDDKPTDALAVIGELKRSGTYEVAGGEATVYEIERGTSSTAYIDRNIANLTVLSELRRQYIQYGAISRMALEPDADPKDIQDKVDEESKYMREVYKLGHKRNLTDEIREWVVSTTGVFMGTDVDKEFKLRTRVDTQTRSKILQRLVSSNIIERYGDKRNCYRLVDSDLEVMDITKGASERLNIKFPFEIEQYVYTNPKSVIVIAGESDAGKSAFLLNIAKMNMDTWPDKIHYFNSEMGEGDLTDRVKAFDDIKPKDWRVKFYERSSNFADVIRPNDLNIIDFMEVYTDFWEIGGWIRDIWKKLDKGVAIIAIQKDPKSDFARGGTITMEKPRLYLSLKYIKEDRCGELEIVKGKNAIHPEIKPRGLKVRYVLYRGAEFKMLDGGWFTDNPQRKG